MLDIPFEGGCQCGAVRYRGTAAPFVRYTCHCLECQRLTASAFSTCIQVAAETLEVTGAPLSRERIADSGNTVTTHFCGNCGSPIFTAAEIRPRIRTIYVGTLDRAESVDVTAHIWTRRRLPWVVLPEGARLFDGPGDWRPDYAADPSRLER